MTYRTSIKNLSSIFLGIILVTIGIKDLFSLGFSSFSIYAMITAALVLPAMMIRTETVFPKAFIKYNIYLFIFIVFYAGLAYLKGKITYPSYIINIIFFQIVFFIIIATTSSNKIIKAFIFSGILNVIFYVLQIIGALVASEKFYTLSFLGIMKGQIEFAGIFPRASALMTEPAHLSYILLPLVVLMIFESLSASVKQNATNKILIVITYIMTLSVIAYVQLIIIGIYRSFFRHSHKLTLLYIALGLVTIMLSLKIDFVSDRLIGLIDLTGQEDTKQSSVFSLQSNFLVMLQTLKESPLFGDGLTSHRFNYDNSVSSFFSFPIDDGWSELNRNDAGSLPFLLLSETGLVGFLCYYLFIFRSLLAFSNDKKNIDMIGLAFTLTLLLVGLRYGQIASVFFMLYIQIIFYRLALVK